MQYEKKYTIVQTPEQYQQAIEHINKHSCLAFDTETTGLNVRKDKVIGLSFCGSPGEAFYVPRMTWNTGTQSLIPVIAEVEIAHLLYLLSEKELLMWNASYDVRIVKNDLGVDLLDSLLADIMLMKHTVEEDGDFGLKDVAIKYQKEIGLDVEREANEEQIILKDNIKKNGGTSTKNKYEMYKADLEVMGNYAAADADLTLRLAILFRERLEKERLDTFFYDKEVMPLYKEVTIPMEEMGLLLDMDLIHKTNKEIDEDIKKLEAEVVKELENIPEVYEWKVQKACALYPEKPSGSFAQEAVIHFGHEDHFPKTKAGKLSITSGSVGTLPDCELRSFLQDSYALSSEDRNAISVALAKKNGDWDINIFSKKQMGEIVFDVLDITPLSKTDKGNAQFNDDMIEELHKSHGLEWAKKLTNYNALIKLKGTYIERFLEEQENGIFYPSFQQHRTISGRYGSNLQQLPRPKEEGELDEVVLKYVNIIRTFFISGKGRVFIDNDYESLEPHVFAHVANDEGLKDIFRKGYDFYSTIAIATEKLTGVSADKKADNYLGKVNKPKRQFAKAYSLGVPYGMKGYALGKTLGLSTEDAEVLVNGYLDGFPMLKKWMHDSELQAKQFGYVSSEVGRVRHLPKVKELYRKHGDKLLDFKYRAKLYPKYGREEVDRWYGDYKNGLNNAKNYQIQSLSASIVNMAAISITRAFKMENIDGWVALNIHDQLVMNVPEEKAQECKELVQDIMENNYKISIKLKAPAAIGKNLKEAH